MKKKTKPILQIIGPVYNEEEVIESFFSSLTKTLSVLKKKYECKIMFVVDKSTDGTITKLKKIARKNKNVQLLILSSRFGHQMSLVAGMDNSDADVTIMMDTDLQHPPELIPSFLREYENGNDVVLGIRNIPVDKSLFKRLSSKFFYKILNFFADIKLKNGEADFRLISKKVLNVFKYQIREQNQFLRGLFSWVGFNKSLVYFNAEERYLGDSKYSWRKMFQFASSGIISFSKKPLRYAAIMGLIVAFLGFSSGCYSIFTYFIFNDAPSGWTTLSVLITIIGGTQLLCIGIIGEYIGNIFEEVKHRPLYIVEEKINLK
jgi:polyisoprenyl-phosphate glycosyltransferase